VDEDAAQRVARAGASAGAGTSADGAWAEEAGTASIARHLSRLGEVARAREAERGGAANAATG
jgi:hypothetical protein